MEKIDSATCTALNTSACDTCRSIVCMCSSYKDEEDLLEFHLTGDVELIPLRPVRILLCHISFTDKIQDGFLLVCAFFALSFNRVVDFVLEGFEKAFRSGRL